MSCLQDPLAEPPNSNKDYLYLNNHIFANIPLHKNQLYRHLQDTLYVFDTTDLKVCIHVLIELT